MHKKYYIKTLGCQMNIADSERIASILESYNLRETSNIKEADIIIFNTCSVRQSAEDRIFGLNKILKKLKIKNSKLKIILTGCMMHYSQKELKKRLPYIDVFLDIKKVPELPRILKLKAKSSKLKINPKDYLSIEAKNFSPFTAFVPISFGCNNFCAYCIVPLSRGREYSRPTKEILKEVKRLVREGYKEIWLLGQNVNSYGIEEKTLWDNKTRRNTKPKLSNNCVSFADLLRRANAIGGNFWIRFTSPHPKDFSDDLIKAMAECKKVTPYLNLPVQSGDDEILKKMNRQYTVNQYKNLVAKIRKAIPNITLSTDIIVGFPTESQKQFNNTARLFKDVEFDMAYISRYSPRPKTAAAKIYKDDISREEKERRYKLLTAILKKTALKKNKQYIGKTANVLIENYKKGFFFGKTDTYKTVKISASEKNPEKLIGQFAKVKITKVNDFGLFGFREISVTS